MIIIFRLPIQTRIIDTKWFISSLHESINENKFIVSLIVIYKTIPIDNISLLLTLKSTMDTFKKKLPNKCSSSVCTDSSSAIIIFGWHHIWHCNVRKNVPPMNWHLVSVMWYFIHVGGECDTCWWVCYDHFSCVIQCLRIYHSIGGDCEQTELTTDAIISQIIAYLLINKICIIFYIFKTFNSETMHVPFDFYSFTGKDNAH